MQNLLNIYRASAGAGKTFFLTESFLKLAFRSPDYYKKILAVTFTNKAAEEMKTRITEKLHDLITNPEESEHLSALLEAFPEMNTEAVRRRAEEIQNEILHNYALFSVSTIDSFVQKVIRAFTFEMNLHSNFNLQLDTDYVMADLRERLYEKLKEDKNLLDWLIQFTRYKINENKSWNFNDEIEALSKEILTEEYQTKGLSNPPAEQLRALQEKLNHIKKEFENKMLNISREADKAIRQLPFDYSKQGRNIKYIGDHLCNKLKKREYAPSPTIMKIYNYPEEWPNKTAKAETLDNIESFEQAVGPLIRQAVDTYINEYPLYLSVNEVLKNFYSFGLLSDIAALLPFYREDNNELLISDTTFLLKELIQNNDAPFIYEKTGNRYHHILIDEFQDTSNYQWLNFKPLINNSLASGNFNLLVGDIKQSIYSWRGGDRTLLMYRVKEQIGAERVSENDLPYNWRSARNIVRLNNTLFKRIPELQQELFNTKTQALSSEENIRRLEEEHLFSTITDAYKNAMQKIPASTKTDGYLRIDFIKKEAGENKPELRKKTALRVADYIDNLLQSGHKAGDMAILVRTKFDGKSITDELYSYQNANPVAQKYQIMSQSSAELSKAPTIKLLTAALKLINRPDDMIKNAELLKEYSDIHDIKPESYHEIFGDTNAAKRILPDEFSEQIDELRNLSLYELSEKLIQLFDLGKTEGEIEFLRNFLDLVFNFSRKKSNDLTDFIEWWDEKGSTESLQNSGYQNAVQILTVHKSKGLGVKHLIVPFADWNTAPKSNSIFWAEDETNFFEGFRWLPVRYSSKLAETIFRKSFYTHTVHGYTEALNLLYVALTRAEHSLFVAAEYPDNTDNPKTAGVLLYKAITQGQISDEDNRHYLDTASLYNHGEYRLETGSIPPPDRKKKEKSDSDKSTALPAMPEFPTNNGSLKPDISYRSHDFFIESIDYIKEKVNYGSLMHRILSAINQPDDAHRVVNDLHTQGYITKAESTKLLHTVSEILNRPQIAPWFKKGLAVISEKAILTTEGLTRIPDRVIIEDGKITVIDFKFGKERPEHLDQINEYKQLLEDIYGQKVIGIIYYATNDKRVQI